MAQRRMFSRVVTESDAFTDMPLTAQALYFHLGMAADDDGFVNNPRRVQRCIGASADDLALLAAKMFVIPFESGVVVVRHWLVHNQIRRDRYHETLCLAEKAALALGPANEYLLPSCEGDALELAAAEEASELAGCQMVAKLETEVSQVKARLGEESQVMTAGADAPTVEAVTDYLNEKTGKGFKPTSKSTSSPINARLREGYALEDFRRVVDNKVAQWGKDPQMNRYLRPETLFGAKFESYLNEGQVIRDEYAEYDV